MQVSRREARGTGSFAFPVLAIVGLLLAYVVLGQWQDLPQIFASAFAAVRWPISG